MSWSKRRGSQLISTDDKDNKLEITNATYNNSGIYVCTATNILGRVEKEVKLIVEGRTLIVLLFFIENSLRSRALPMSDLFCEFTVNSHSHINRLELGASLNKSRTSNSQFPSVH